jgi:hypothetical protein
MDTQGSGGTVQTASTIINIDHLDNGNFNLKNQNKPFNQYLTKVLITVIKDYSDDAAKFLDDYKDQPDWNQVSAISGEAQDYIISCYVNVIGGQLRPLIAIGMEKYSDDQQKRYIDKCIAIGKITLQVLCFALISDIWNQKKQKDFPLLPDEATAIKSFFEYSRQLDWDIGLYMNLFKTLDGIYTRQELALPIPELAGFSDKLATGSDFCKACDQLCAIQNAKDVDKYTYNNCDLAERSLADFLAVVGFLASYKMVTIKSVNYDEARNTSPHYLHNYVELGAGNTAAGLKYIPDPVNTDAILLYKGNYMKSGINLFPFILDYNALNITGGVKIGVYSSIDVNKPKSNDDDDDGNANSSVNIMRLYFPEDDTRQTISFAGIMKPDTNLNALFRDDPSRIQLKKDTVFLQFWDAKKTILGTN